MSLKKHTRDKKGDIAEIYVKAAKKLLVRFGWSLLEPDELASRAIEYLNACRENRSPDNACLQVYAAEMYRYIIQDGGPKREFAYNELWRYLLAVAKRRSKKERAEEFAQRTVKIIWQKIGQCRSAHCFIGWATTILINEIRQDYRYRTRHESIPDNGPPSHHRICRTESLEIPIEKTSGQQEPVENDLVRQQACERLMSQLDALLPDKQIAVILGLYLQERKPADLAKELDHKVQYIYVLKDRALRKLRKSDRILKILREMSEIYPIKAGDE